jgi:6-phosphogluconolactonase (cycloisomerase 2 family)
MTGFGRTSSQAVTMKIKIGAVLLAAAAFIAGCSGFWTLPASTSTTTTTTTLSSGYFYVLDKSTAQVIPYYIDAGTLTPGSSIAVANTPSAIAVAPNNEFLYVSTLNGIYLYTISDGVLTLGNSSQAITSDPAVAMQVDSTNSWLVETSGTGTLNAVPIVSTSGLLNTSSPICNTTTQSQVCSVSLAGATINQLAIAPNNEYVFVAAATNGTEAFGFAAANSDPFGSASGPYVTKNPVTNTTGSALSVAVDPSNRLLYVGEADAVSDSGGLRVFTIDTTNGTLTEQTKEGSPYASGGTGPNAILPKSTGDYVYVANWNGTSTGNITGFSITDSNSTFSLTELSNPVATGVQPRSLVEDSEHNFVLAANSGGNPYLDAYYFDTTTVGQLDTTIKSTNYAAYVLAANH